MYWFNLPIIESKNSSRMPAMHRLDMCLKFTKEFKYFDFKFDFGVYNVYARKNPYYISEIIPFKYEVVNLFKTIPYLTLGLKF